MEGGYLIRHPAALASIESQQVDRRDPKQPTFREFPIGRNASCLR